MVTASMSACSLLGGESPEAGSNEQVEKSSLRVAVLPSVEAAPLHWAVQEGYFAEEGIESVQVTTVSSGQDATAGLLGGDYDLVYSSYVPLILAQAKGAADLRIVTDNSGAAPDTAVVVVNGTSKIQHPEDLEGARIAVPAVNTMADLMVKSVLDTHGVDVEQVRWAQMSFADMPAALKAKRVDAAMMVEPFITLSAVEHGAKPVVDLAQGPTAEMPFTTYAATAEWVEQHPKTVRAWQRVSERAAEAAQDREVAERVIVDEVGIDPQTAALINLPSFRSSLDASRVQRVADLMHQFGVLDEHFDVEPMLVPPLES